MCVPDLSLVSIPFKMVSLFSDTQILTPFSLLEQVMEVLLSMLTRHILQFPLELLKTVKSATL
jgi:hypothetical protein